MTSSIRTTVHESLPYIDTEPTPTERSAAEALITSELSSSSPSTSSHPSLPPLSPPKFTPLMTLELQRIAANEPISGIDTTRYEIQDPPPSPSSSPNSPFPPTSSLTGPLSRAYTTHTYLQSRQTHLHLLDTYGKNAWLVSNWQTESQLAALEADLSATKREIDIVNISRRRMQDEVGEEMRGLEETWKKGVGRVLETEVATEELRRRILEKKRDAA
ncbi:Pre-mRNA-splicing factor SPF27 [Xylaria curta]|nr:Pre-mRNA-splicing factor SPF27 [Xylaria curta]